MKKFWKVRVDANYKKTLQSLGITDWYIDILTDKNYEPMEYIKAENSKYIFISYNSKYRDSNKFCWERIDNYEYMMKNYTFCGTINVRKDKLKKIYETINN